MADQDRARHEIENALRLRFEASMAAHNVARIEHKRLLQLVSDFSSNDPDAHLALRQAARLAKAAYEACVENHKATLKDFTDLTVLYIDPRDKK